MKFTNTKLNFKELWKDIKVISTTAVCLVKDTVSVPISMCKDVRDTYVENKKFKEQVKKYTEAKKDQKVEVIEAKPQAPRKPRNRQPKLTPSQ